MTGYQVRASGFDGRMIARSGVAGGNPAAALLPLAILFYSFLLFPPEVRFQAVGLNLPLYRILIIAFLPVILTGILKGRMRFSVVDLLVGISSLWMMASFIAFFGLGEGTVRSGALVIDAFGSYLLARTCLTSPRSLRYFLIIIVPGLLFAGLVMMTESLAHRMFFRPFFSDIFGPLPAYADGNESGVFEMRPEVRLGFMRAFGPFSHPILGGVILTSLLSAYALSGLRSWPRIMGIGAAFLGFFSISSAAILSLLIAGALLAADYGRRFVRGLNWPLIVTGLALLLLALQVVSKNGVIPILLRYTLTPGTGYFRLLIWENGWQSIMNHPWIGIGYNEYDRPSWMYTASVDAHFLALGIRHGLITPLALLLAMIVAMVGLGRNAARVDPIDRRLFIGLNITMAGLLLASMTVMFFGEANIWFMALLGICVSMVTWRPQPDGGGVR